MGTTTMRRQFPFVSLPVRKEDPGYPVSVSVFNPISITGGQLIDSQETVSYRTGKSVGDTDQITSEDLRTTRNGFTTFSPQYDAGHEFYTTRTSTRISHPSVTLSTFRDGKRYVYEGPLVPNINSSSQWVFPPVRKMSTNDINLYGNRAISAVAPTAPQASAATTISELMLDGLPSLVGLSALRSASNPTRGAGGEYLNAQFGWAPMISDLKSIVRALKKSSQTIQQLQRDSGRNVRRRFSFPVQMSSIEATYVVSGNASVFYGVNAAHDLGGTTTDGVSRKTVSMSQLLRQEMWFAGSFTSYFPTPTGWVDKVSDFEKKADAILGTRLTPEVLWEIAPWSWLVDWKLAIGDFLSAATLRSNPDFVIRYGYLMRHTREDFLYSAPYHRFYNGVRVGSPTLRLRRETKERRRSTPFGFGITETDINPFRWSILAALGMTKGPNILRYS